MTYQMTIVFLLKQEKDVTYVCLAEKKRRFRQGKINGYGGKMDSDKDETLLDTAVRELEEESGVTDPQLIYMGEVNFIDTKLHGEPVVHCCTIYTCYQWTGDPHETEEMNEPEWFNIYKLPYERMGQADSYWIQKVLEGNIVQASFYYNEANELYDKQIEFSNIDSVEK